MPPPAREVPAARAGHEAGPFLPVSVRKCHKECTDRPAGARAEAAERERQVGSSSQGTDPKQGGGKGNREEGGGGGRRCRPGAEDGLEQLGEWKELARQS